MNKAEIATFIEEMEAIGDEWTEDEVKDVYGDDSLEDALANRKSAVGTFLDGIASIFQ